LTVFLSRFSLRKLPASTLTNITILKKQIPAANRCRAYPVAALFRQSNSSISHNVHSSTHLKTQFSLKTCNRSLTSTGNIRSCSKWRSPEFSHTNSRLAAPQAYCEIFDISNPRFRDSSLSTRSSCISSLPVNRTASLYLHLTFQVVRVMQSEALDYSQILVI